MFTMRGRISSIDFTSACLSMNRRLTRLENLWAKWGKAHAKTRAWEGHPHPLVEFARIPVIALTHEVWKSDDFGGRRNCWLIPLCAPPDTTATL